MTAKANISLGQQNATDDEIIEALKKSLMPKGKRLQQRNGYTNIGDSGNKLSGGQKQRLFRRRTKTHKDTDNFLCHRIINTQN
jgi:ABC-type multidrug transport system fused ATPase/permease subunit